MQKRKWAELIVDPLYKNRWAALADCEYEGDALIDCVVVDTDDDIAKLQLRLEEHGIKNCTIKRVSEGEGQASETPRVTRSGSAPPES